MASQVIAAISTVILLTYSVMKVKRKTILICNMVINFLLAVHYLMLGSYTGAVCSLITVFMVAVFYFKDRFKKIIGLSFLIFFILIFTVSGMLTWEGPWSLIPVVGNVLLAVALWNDNENIIKGLFIAIGILWIILNIHLRSITNTVGQVLAVTSNIIYFFRVARDKSVYGGSAASEEKLAASRKSGNT